MRQSILDTLKDLKTVSQKFYISMFLLKDPPGQIDLTETQKKGIQKLTKHDTEAPNHTGNQESYSK